MFLSQILTSDDHRSHIEDVCNWKENCLSNFGDYVKENVENSVTFDINSTNLLLLKNEIKLIQGPKNLT